MRVGMRFVGQRGKCVSEVVEEVSPGMRKDSKDRLRDWRFHN